jgi:uncharacterized protein (DUF302 family)
MADRGGQHESSQRAHRRFHCGADADQLLPRAADREQASPLGFDATIDRITANAHAQGWEVPRAFDFQKSLTERDKPDPGRMTVLKLCSPDFAWRMFAQDESKYVAVMAPCSIAVYEKTDGRTYVSTMNMKLMSKLLEPEVGPVLGDIAAEDEQILAFTH